MASRNNFLPPYFRLPWPRCVHGAGSSLTPVDVDLEATSIDADEYIAGLHGGQ
jgi:hypothetical protein